MQLKKIILLFILLFPFILKSQNKESDGIELSEGEQSFLLNYYESEIKETENVLIIDTNSNQINNTTSASPIVKENEQKVDVNILFNYYQQDGNNSSVSSGLGTEELTAYEAAIVVQIPIDSVSSIGAAFGFVNISGASFKRIDALSEASSKSYRIKHRYYGSVSYQRTIKNKNIGGNFHFSDELDMLSLGGGISMDFPNKYNNRLFEVGLGATFDDRKKISYPGEIKNIIEPDNAVKTSKRNTYSLSLSYSWVANKRMQIRLMGDLIYQEGLLSIPFHRIFFNNWALKVEQLPDKKIKIPLAIRMNYHINDFLIGRFYYRFYYDDFGIIANTINVEMPVKLSSSVRLYPFYRYHVQTASDYFADFNEHKLEDVFFTCDHDLRDLNSQKLGLGIKIKPPSGIFKFRRSFKHLDKLGTMKNIELRYARYFRSAYLESDIVTLSVNFEL